MMLEPIGVSFLVRGQCSCGWWMAAPEGSTWPLCPDCGERVWPPQTHEGDEEPRLGYVALLFPEEVAARFVNALP